MGGGGSRAPLSHRCSGSHLPRVAGLLQCLACGGLSGLNGLQDAGVSAGGFHSPLNETVLIDAQDDAAGGKGASWDMWMGVLEITAWQATSVSKICSFRSALFYQDLGPTLPKRLQKAWILLE